MAIRERSAPGVPELVLQLTRAGFLALLWLFVFIALRVSNSRQAVLQALGTVFFLSVGTLVCIYLIVINGGTFEYQFLSFSLFLIAGIGGLLWVLSADQPTQALTLASILLPICLFYCVTNVLVAQPGSQESAPPLIPFLSVAIPFVFAMLAMLVPMLSEFDVAFGRTRVQGRWKGVRADFRAASLRCRGRAR